MPNTFNLSDIFISYSRRDKDFVEQLDAFFKSQKMEVWIDWEDIPAATNWWEEIKAGIDGASTFLFVISPDSVLSKYCASELEYAIQQRKHLIPLMYRTLPEDGEKTIPEVLAIHNWVLFNDQHSFEQQCADLLVAVKTDLTHRSMHTRVMVRSQEWNQNQYDNSFLLSGRELTNAETWLLNTEDVLPTPTNLQRTYIITSGSVQARRQRRLLGAVVVILAIVLIMLGVSLVLMQQNSILNTQNRGIVAMLRAEAVLDNGQFEEAFQQVRDNADLLETSSESRMLSQLVLRQLAYDPGILQRYSGHDDHIKSVAISPDGSMLVSAGGDPFYSTRNASDSPPLLDTRVLIWDTESGTILHQLIGHQEPVTSVEFSPDGRYVLSGSSDPAVILWDANTGQEIRRFVGHDESCRVWDVMFTPDGIGALTADSCSRIFIWNVETGGNIDIFEGHPDFVNAIAIAPDGQTVVSVDDSANSAGAGVLVWNLKTQEIIHELSGHTHFVIGVDITSDGRYAVTASRDSTVRLWDIILGEEVAQFTVSPQISQMQSVAITPDDRYAVIATGNSQNSNSLLNVLILWDLQTQEEVALFRGHDAPIWDVAVSDDGTFAVSASEDQTLIRWSLVQLDAGQTTTLPSAPQSISAVAGTDDVLITTSRAIQRLNRVIGEVYDLYNAPEMRTLGHSRLIIETSTIAVLEYSTTDLTAAAEIVVLDIATGSEQNRITIPYHSRSLLAATQFILQGSQSFVTLASRSDNISRLSLIQSDDNRHTVLNTRMDVLATNNNGQRIAVSGCSNRACDTGRIAIFDPELELIWSARVHRFAVKTTVFSPDDQWLLTAGCGSPIARDAQCSGEATIFDAESGDIVEVIGGRGSHENAGIEFAVFSPDMNLLATISNQRPTSNQSRAVVVYWDTQTWSVVRRFILEDKSVDAVTINADGSTLILAGVNETHTQYFISDYIFSISTSDLLARVENRYAYLLNADCEVSATLISGNCAVEPTTTATPETLSTTMILGEEFQILGQIATGETHIQTLIIPPDGEYLLDIIWESNTIQNVQLFSEPTDEFPILYYSSSRYLATGNVTIGTFILRYIAQRGDGVSDSGADDDVAQAQGHIEIESMLPRQVLAQLVSSDGSIEIWISSYSAGHYAIRLWSLGESEAAQTIEIGSLERITHTPIPTLVPLSTPTPQQ